MIDISLFNYFGNVHQRIYWLYLFSALLLAIAVLYPKGSIRENLFNKRLWFHPSATLDYRYFVVALFIKGFVIVPMMISAFEINRYILEGIYTLFGYREFLHVDRVYLAFFYTLALFMVSDFTRYWLHRAEHSLPLLWRFHKVHHSAEVLNPLTFYRVHPVENILFGLRYALSTGVVTALFSYFFGPSLHVVDLLGANLFVFIFSLMGSNLRHSHVALSYGTFFEKIFISPSAHQIHHSKTGMHSNFGGYLAIWDTLFATKANTLHVTSPFGLNEPFEHTLRSVLLTPFYKGKIV